MKISGCFTYTIPSFSDSHTIAEDVYQYTEAVNKFIEEKDLPGLLLYVSSKDDKLEDIVSALEELKWGDCQKT